MPPQQLKETTMDKSKRSLLRITLPEDYLPRKEMAKIVDDLMGKKPEKRFNFIRDNADKVQDLDI